MCSGLLLSSKINKKLCFKTWIITTINYSPKYQISNHTSPLSIQLHPNPSHFKAQALKREGFVNKVPFSAPPGALAKNKQFRNHHSKNKKSVKQNPPNPPFLKREITMFKKVENFSQTATNGTTEQQK